MSFSGRAVARLLLAAVALVALVCVAGAAQADDEPNNRPADAQYMARSAVGSCADGPDFVVTQMVGGWATLVNYSVLGADGSPLAAKLGLYTPDGQPFRTTYVLGNGSVGLVPRETGRHYVSLLCASESGTWNLSVFEPAARPSISGPDESEFNDLSGQGDSLLGANVSGAMDATYDPIDCWRFSPGGGDKVVTLTASGGLTASLWSLGTDGTPFRSAGSNLTLRDMANTSAAFAVIADSGSGTYWLVVRAASPPAVFEGPDEAEPNGSPVLATKVDLQPSTQIDGTGDFSDDAYDWYEVSVGYPTVVRGSIESLWGCSPGACDLVHVMSAMAARATDAVGRPVGDGKGFEWVAPAGSSFFLRVSSGVQGGPYRIQLDALPFPLAEGATVDLADGVANGTLEGYAYCTEQWPLVFVNLTLGGNGAMYGPSMDAVVLSHAPVSLEVTARAGTTLYPTSDGLAVYMVTRDRAMTVGAGAVAEAPIWAAMTRPGGVPTNGATFSISGHAEGSEAAIANVTASGGYSGISEILALWAANGLDTSDLVARGAPYSAISDARAVLNDAGVQTSINPPAAHYEEPPEPERSPYALPVALAVGALALALEAYARIAPRPKGTPAGAGPGRLAPPPTQGRGPPCPACGEPGDPRSPYCGRCGAKR